MLKIILFGYSRGLVSSRCIANACETNITDLDSAKVSTSKGTIQGYNGLPLTMISIK
ncbi:hypothetical protein ACLKMH_10930 [Psychromonas sp. KJ10-10]|uniref:hypothetical protein n=1 Tax=Psychromonas sp. KJ10-10 TaxID=3391823 RepID=UPI0039B405D4